MPSFIIRRIPGYDPEADNLEEALERTIRETNRNFNLLKHLMYGGLDFANATESGFLQTWQDSSEDNMDNANPMSVDIYIPSETHRIHKILLRIRKKQYRADATTASSGGGSTSGSGGGQTSSSGGGGTSGSGGGTTTSSGGSTTPTSSSEGGHTHIWDLNVPPGTTSVTSGHTHEYFDFRNAGQAISGAHTHTVSISGHVHTVGDHTHSVSNHTHTVSDHTHSTPAHAHDLAYGINLLTLPPDAGFTVKVNGVDRTAALGGPFAGNVDELDLTEWFVIGQWNTVAVGCGAGIRVRVQAQVFVQAFVNPIGRLDPEE